MNDEFGDATELEIIIEKGQQEAFEFGAYEPIGTRPVLIGSVFRPAKWLNPPKPIIADADIPAAGFGMEEF